MFVKLLSFLYGINKSFIKISATGPIEMDLTKTYLSNNEVNSHHIIYLFLLCLLVVFF